MWTFLCGICHWSYSPDCYNFHNYHLLSTLPAILHIMKSVCFHLSQKMFSIEQEIKEVHHEHNSAVQRRSGDNEGNLRSHEWVRTQTIAYYGQRNSGERRGVSIVKNDCLCLSVCIFIFQFFIFVLHSCPCLFISRLAFLLRYIDTFISSWTEM